MARKTETICVRMTPKTYKLLKSWAEKNGKTISEWIRWQIILFQDLMSSEYYKQKIVEHYNQYFRE